MTRLRWRLRRRSSSRAPSPDAQDRPRFPDAQYWLRLPGAQDLSVSLSRFFRTSTEKSPGARAADCMAQPRRLLPGGPDPRPPHQPPNSRFRLGGEAPVKKGDYPVEAFVYFGV